MTTDYHLYSPEEMTFTFSTPLGHRSVTLDKDGLRQLMHPDQQKFIDRSKDKKDLEEDYPHDDYDVPVGSIVAYYDYKGQGVPPGYVKCDGSSTRNYPKLQKALEKYGNVA